MPRGGPRFATRKLSTWSRRPLNAVDGRTLEARREKIVLAELTEHLGGNPTVPQRILIARAARILVVTEVMERRIMEGTLEGERAVQQVLAWTNTLTRLLHALGIKQAEAGPKRLADVLKIKAA